MKTIDWNSALEEAILSFPGVRRVQHCGAEFEMPALSIYGVCPKCTTKLKVRAFGGIGTELEDIMDVFCQWLNKPGALESAKQRAAEVKSEPE